MDTVLIRMDKIGDLVLSLPVDEHPAFGGRPIRWFIARGMGFVPANARARAGGDRVRHALQSLRIYADGARIADT